MSIHAHRFPARPQPADLTAAMTRALIALLDGPLSRGRKGFLHRQTDASTSGFVRDASAKKFRDDVARFLISDLTAMCLVRRGLAVVSPGGTSLKLTELGRYLAAERLSRRAEPLAREASP